MVKLVTDHSSYKQYFVDFWQRYTLYNDEQLEVMSNQMTSSLRLDAYCLFETIQQSPLRQSIFYQDFDDLLSNLTCLEQIVNADQCLLLLLLRQWWREWSFALSMATKKHGQFGMKSNEHRTTESTSLEISKYTNLFAHVPIPLCNVCTLTGNIIRLNQRFIDVFGYDLDDTPTLAAWWLHAYPDPQYREQVQQRWQQALIDARINNTDIEPQDYQVSCKNGEQITMEISGTIIGNEFLAIFKDATQRLAAEDILRDMAFLDSLTQIANRRCFDETLHNQLELMQQQLKPLSMILLDIDYFKQYNDNYGHIKGDECLYQIAQCIAATMNHEKDFVARFGGEEFVVLMPSTNAKQAFNTALQIQQAITQLAIKHEYAELGYITLSMGIKTLNRPKAEEQLIFVDAADKALYQAKGKGRNTIVVSKE